MQQQSYTATIGDQTVTAHVTDLAFQANGSVTLTCNGTVVLAAATQGNDEHKNPGYFNLTVEYIERFYATGKIGGSQYQRREARPSLSATLASRIIDRTCRPLFDQKDKKSVQLIVTVLSVGDFDPVVLATNAISMALHISDIPWGGPIGCARIGVASAVGAGLFTSKKPDQAIINPYNPNDPAGANLSADLLVCGDGVSVNMIEMGAHEISETLFDSLLDVAVMTNNQWVSFIKDIQSKAGKTKSVAKKPTTTTNDLETLYTTSNFQTRLEADLFGPDSKTRIGKLHSDWETVVETARESAKSANADSSTGTPVAPDYSHFDDFLDTKIDAALHNAAIKDKKRADGRALNQVRALYAQAGGLSDRLHGSGIFYRGETHVVSIATLAGPDSNLVHDSMDMAGEQRFWHHYNFPPYSVGETGRMGSTGRRELGHGALAEKALWPVLPTTEEFPYTVRVVSECVSSNGSTSQASVCAATLALMDAGVPITRPVVGISIGLMMDESDGYALLTDIQGPEDHHGDMDFKVAGTSQGITAIQLDIKLNGIPVDICRQAVRDARVAHETILKTILATIPAPRAELSPYAPRIEIITIDPEKIGLVIGGGGKTIQAIQKDTNTKISIEDDGRVYITGIVTPGAPAGQLSGPAKARSIIEEMTHEWAVGEIITGIVVKIIDETGAIVEWGNTSGMIHISELSQDRVSRVSDKLSPGQTVTAVIVAVDPERDRISLSMKKLPAPTK